MEVLDPGHKYRLFTLDGKSDVILTFVKRCDPPNKYPGNSDSYPGTTIQDVLRCLIDRIQYLDLQKFNPINQQIIGLLRLSIWLLEIRAAENKGAGISTALLTTPELRHFDAKDGHFTFTEQ